MWNANENAKAYPAGGPESELWMPSGCVQANVTSGIASIADEMMREEIAFLTSVVSALRAMGESPQCPLINLGQYHSSPTLGKKFIQQAPPTQYTQSTEPCVPTAMPGKAKTDRRSKGKSMNNK
jgi:hypothetical protein